MTIKQFFHHLNRRDTRLLPKNLTATKLIVICFVAFTAISLTKQILAQTTTPAVTTGLDEKTQDEIIKKQDAYAEGKINAENWGKEDVYGKLVLWTNIVGGKITKDNLSGKTAWIPQGLLGITNNAITYLYSPPASGVEYIAQSFNSFLGKPAYATTGFEGLQGIMSLWKAFRNVAYVVISLIFIIIGILIMLRIKINPQTIVNIQNTIPKLITTLILITFSYVIAGLLIDLSGLLQSLALSVLFQSKGGLTSQLFNGGYNPTFSDLNSMGFWKFFLLLYKLVPMAWITLLAGIPSAIIGGVIAGATLGYGAPIGFIVGGITFVLVLLIVLIMILVLVIRFFFGIAKCYVNLIMRIILGPLEIGLGAFPGSQLNFSSWIKEVVANLVVFPISVIYLVLVTMILDTVSNSGVWTPSLFLGGGITGALFGIAALMIFSKLPTLIPEVVFQIKPSPFGKAIGEGLGALPGHGIAKSIGGTVRGGVSEFANKRINESLQQSSLGDRVGQLEARRVAARDERKARRDARSSSRTSETSEGRSEIPAGSRGSGPESDY